MAGERHTLVKVCGITREPDGRAAIEAGADLLGFVLSESPRQVAPEKAAEILAAVRAAGVAVMVRPTPDEALALARRAGTVRVQLHGVRADDWPADFPLDVIFVLRVGEDALEAPASLRPRHWLLCDTARADRWGGTGESFEWSQAEPLARRVPLLLSGGLAADNVGAALAAARPMGVDASSRLETSPGVKDPDRVRDFVAAVRRFDQEVGRV